jgi:hypothetical protein
MYRKWILAAMSAQMLMLAPLVAQPAPTSTPAVESSDSSAKDDLRKDIASIQSRRPTSNIADVLHEFEDLQTKWSRKSPTGYVQITREICSRLNSVDYGDMSIQKQQAQVLAMRLLRSVSTIAESDELWMVMYIRTDHTRFPDAEKELNRWAKQRAAKADLLLHAYARMEKFLAATEKLPLPQMNLLPPDGAIAGGDPRAIADPKKRAEYEAAIKANEERLRSYGQERELRAWRDRFNFGRTVESALVILYTDHADAASFEELKTSLAKYSISEVMQTRILNEVRKGPETSTNASTTQAR